VPSPAVLAWLKRRMYRTEKIDPLSPQTQGRNKIRTPSQRKRVWHWVT
jgi:hypothetical protein